MKPAAKWIAEFKKTIPSNVFVHTRAESQFWNDALRDVIKEVEQEYQTQLKITLVDTPRTKKYDRIVTGLEAFWQNFRIFWNEKMKANNSCQIGLQQWYGIKPNYHTHDDAPDADEQAITYLSKFISYSSGSSRKPKVGKVKSKNII